MCTVNTFHRKLQWGSLPGLSPEPPGCAPSIWTPATATADFVSCCYCRHGYSLFIMVTHVRGVQCTEIAVRYGGCLFFHLQDVAEDFIYFSSVFTPIASQSERELKSPNLLGVSCGDAETQGPCCSHNTARRASFVTSLFFLASYPRSKHRIRQMNDLFSPLSPKQHRRPKTLSH